MFSIQIYYISVQVKHDKTFHDYIYSINTFVLFVTRKNANVLRSRRDSVCTEVLMIKNDITKRNFSIYRFVEK